MYVNVGSSHSINCSVSSPDPPHHVFWYFNQEVIKDIGHRIKASNILQPLSQDGSWMVSNQLAQNNSWSRLTLHRFVSGYGDVK